MFPLILILPLFCSVHIETSQNLLRKSKILQNTILENIKIGGTLVWYGLNLYKNQVHFLKLKASKMTKTLIEKHWIVSWYDALSSHLNVGYKEEWRSVTFSIVARKSLEMVPNRAKHLVSSLTEEDFCIPSSYYLTEIWNLV